MDKYNPFSSIMETYLENRRRIVTIPALPPPPASTSSAAKHPLFGPIPPHLLHKYLSPTLSISLYNSPGHSSPSDRPLPPPLSNDTNICLPPSPQPSSSSAKQVSPTQQCSSPFTEIYMATIQDDPSEPPFKKKDDIVTLNTCRGRIIIDDDIDTSFCPLLTEDYSFFLEEDDSFSLEKDDSFFLDEISSSTFYQSLGEGNVRSTSDLKGEKVSDNPVSRKQKSDDFHFGSHNYNTRCKAKRCF